MGLLGFLVRLPILPVTGVVKIAELIQDQAERELHDPAAVRRRLEAAEEARASGQASDKEIEKIEEEAVGRLVRPADPSGPTSADPSG